MKKGKQLIGHLLFFCLLLPAIPIISNAQSNIEYKDALSREKSHIRFRQQLF